MNGGDEPLLLVKTSLTLRTRLLGIATRVLLRDLEVMAAGIGDGGQFVQTGRVSWTGEAGRAIFVDMPQRELIAAIDLLAAGDWRRAHEIVQKHDSTLGAWLHGIVHTLEGDDDNARYWYQQAGRTFRGRPSVEEEIAAARQAASAT
jgi:hypothetical protein